MNYVPIKLNANEPITAGRLYKVEVFNGESWDSSWEVPLCQSLAEAKKGRKRIVKWLGRAKDVRIVALTRFEEVVA